MYVATNHGCLYHARLSSSGNVTWTELVHIPEEGPIITMDVMPGGNVHEPCALDDWVALGDGKGNMTTVRVIGDMCNPLAVSNQSWKASPERQLLGTFWCKSLGYRFVFSSNPRGLLKLWKLSDPLTSTASVTAESYDVSLLAEFSSCFGMRIMCIDASVENEALLLSKNTEEEEEVPEELATYECCFETEDSNANNHDSVFVFNLDTSLARDEIKTALRKHFESCGVEVTRVFVPIECRTGVPLGFAFVDVDDNLKAIKGHSRFMGSRLMFITLADRRPECTTFPNFKGCERCGHILMKRRLESFLNGGGRRCCV